MVDSKPTHVNLIFRILEFFKAILLMKIQRCESQICYSKMHSIFVTVRPKSGLFPCMIFMGILIARYGYLKDEVRRVVNIRENGSRF